MPAEDRNRRPRRANHSPGVGWVREWGLRGLLAFGAAVIALLSLSNTLANVLIKASPAAAYALAPLDGRVVAALAQERFSASPDSGTNSEEARLASRAVRLDATAVDAINVLAMQAAMRNETAKVDKLFGYSFALSRRELQPQIWTIEKSVDLGDIEGALAKYDLAFRTSKRAQLTLFPVLASALAEPRVRRSILQLLVTKPVWAEDFLNYASAQGRDSHAVSQLFREGEGRLAIKDEYRSRVVNGLVSQGEVEEAWNFFATYRPDAARDRSRDPHFDIQHESPSTFDWTMGTAPGLSVAIVQGEGAAFLEFSVPPSTPALVVEQTQVMPRGRYRLVGTSAGIEQPERSLPYWSLTCRGGSELGRLTVPNSSQHGGKFAGEFVVTSNCPVQTLSLMARASDGAAGVFGQIKEVQLARVN